MPKQKKPNYWSAIFKDPADQARLRATSNQQMEANLVATMDASIARAWSALFIQIARNFAARRSAERAAWSTTQTSRRRFNSRLILRAQSGQFALDADRFGVASDGQRQGPNPAEAGRTGRPSTCRAVPGDPFAPGSPLRLHREMPAVSRYIASGRTAWTISGVKITRSRHHAR